MLPPLCPRTMLMGADNRPCQSWRIRCRLRLPSVQRLAPIPRFLTNGWSGYESLGNRRIERANLATVCPLDTDTTRLRQTADYLWRWLPHSPLVPATNLWFSAIGRLAVHIGGSSGFSCRFFSNTLDASLPNWWHALGLVYLFLFLDCKIHRVLSL